MSTHFREIEADLDRITVNRLDVEALLARMEHGALLRQANLLRRERHRAVYGGIPTVSRADIEAGLVLARRLAPIFRDAALTDAAGGA